jgi:GTPase
MKPVVAIIGRPNVGKSTLFNALARKNIAVIDDQPGVTRDRNYIDVVWEDRRFTLVDTGGFDPGIDDEMSELVTEHAKMAVSEADCIIFLMDGMAGLTHGDVDIARILQKSNKPVIYAVNKMEGRQARENLTDYYRIGIDAVISIAARHKEGLWELMEEVCRRIAPCAPDADGDDETVVSIIGRPNAGKSSLINKLIGKNRFVVSSIAGTTRDAVDTDIRFKNRTIRFIDTAGIRKKSRIGYALEKYCAFQAFQSVSRSSICMLLIDAAQGVSTQDAKLADIICERNRACIVVLNKWDLIEKDTRTMNEFIKNVRDKLAFLDYAPVMVVSAKTGVRVRTLLDTICLLHDRYRIRVATAELNRALQDITASKPPPKGATRTKFFYATQVSSGPPVFKIFTNNPHSIPRHYNRYLERRFREQFGFEGVPVELQFAHKSKDGKR